MSYLKYQNEIPEFLTFYLKYTNFIERAAKTTTDEAFNDLRTFFRYIKLLKNNNEITKEVLSNTSIIDVTINDIQSVTRQDIDKFLYFLKYDLENNPKTRNRKVATLKKFFEYMVNNNYITYNPAASYKSATVEKRLPKYLNLDESKTLLSKTAKTEERNTIRNYAIICLFLNCCLRLSELVEINITDIKLDDKTLKVTGKGNKERSSTEIYTHVSNKKLKEIMENCAISSLIERMEELSNGKLQ